MMSPLWPALAATGALVLFLMGYRMLRGRVADYLDASDLILLDDERRREAVTRTSPLTRLAGRFATRLRRLISPAVLDALQRQVDYAGRPPGVTVESLLRRMCWWLLLMIPVGILFVVQGQLVALPLLPLVAVLVPLMPVAARARRRREAIDRDLPDFLDILAVTVSAGMSFRGALARVADHFSGAFSDEIRLTLGQLSHGSSVRVAFTGLAQRTGSVAVRTFVTAFLQAEELGAPLATTLNQIAVDMRRDSAQRMRRKAGQTAPRVTLVTSMVLVPACLILVIAGLVIGADIDFAELFEAFS
ncbi:type II secretion system F family protein [Microlunatus parietis]|uniref:Tight adherence protein C n=1 Tax=Microlunatus parietis TaxID=682979 RepID=A0A7Y9IDF8_9ACTN|nr:type II secretion system F family protein [Microlunatus parietis]NYE74906.1 tight adherence protein C [Microlunatus parietis]